MSAGPRSAWPADRLDPQSLEDFVLGCLDTLAKLAQAQGQSRRAARLLDAAELLRQDSEQSRLPGVTRREWEVATAIARGASNRQIAHELVISERTVDTHVSHMLRKLGLVSRAQIAAWVVENRRQFRVLSVR